MSRIHAQSRLKCLNCAIVIVKRIGPQQTNLVKVAETFILIRGHGRKLIKHSDHAPHITPVFVHAL